MTQKTLQTLVESFFFAYRDPEIEKRLFFDVWADRAGLAAGPKGALWKEVKRLTFKKAAEKRARARVRQRAGRLPTPCHLSSKTQEGQPHR